VAVNVKAIAPRLFKVVGARVVALGVSRPVVMQIKRDLVRVEAPVLLALPHGIEPTTEHDEPTEHLPAMAVGRRDCNSIQVPVPKKMRLWSELLRRSAIDERRILAVRLDGVVVVPELRNDAH
jgi:hypothetical protein